MNLKRLAFPLVFILFLLIGCAQEPQPTATDAPADIVEEPVSTATIVVVTRTLSPTVGSKPTITPAPTPVSPALSIGSQVLSEEGTLTIESVTSVVPGWVVIYADNNGSPGAVLGFEAVVPETVEGIDIAIDPWAATPILHAKLHLDSGDSGEFEFPGSDTPVQVVAEEVLETFTVDIQLPVPSIEVSDQAIGRDGLVSIGSVLTLSPNWLVIHAQENGAIGNAIGQVPLDEGQNSNLVFPIRWREGTDKLWAVLYEDKERPGGFDPSKDLPVLVGGAAVVADFKAQLPPDIFAYDQAAVNGTLSIERAVSEKPGWLVVYNDNEGQPDSIIGFEGLHEGVNEFIEVEILGSAVTPQLFLSLHEESNNPTEFNFPAGDYPATYEGQIIAPTILLTNPGNYLVTRDQVPGNNGDITVPLVVIDLDAWLVIYTVQEDGQPDEIIGQLWLPAGVNRNNLVPFSAAHVGELLLAALHQDAGTQRQFDYPDGEDTPLLRNREIIFAPFVLEEYTGEGIVSP